MTISMFRFDHDGRTYAAALAVFPEGDQRALSFREDPYGVAMPRLVTLWREDGWSAEVTFALCGRLGDQLRGRGELLAEAVEGYYRGRVAPEMPRILAGMRRRVFSGAESVHTFADDAHLFIRQEVTRLRGTSRPLVSTPEASRA